MNASSFMAGILHGLLGGLLGLGGAAWRVPRTHDVDVLRTATSLVVVVAAWLCRAKIVPLDVLATHFDVVFSLVAGCLAGAWWRVRNGRVILVVLAALVLVAVAWPALAAGVLAGVAIGMVMGYDMAAGLLLVPALVLLYGLDIQVAGSLALMVSVPLLVTGLVRSTATWLAPHQALVWGAAVGAALGTSLLCLLPSHVVMTLLEALLVYAAFINFSALFTKSLYVKS